MVWDKLDYLSEVEKQLGDKASIMLFVNGKILCDLVETSNNMFLHLNREVSVSQKGMIINYHKNAINL